MERAVTKKEKEDGDKESDKQDDEKAVEDEINNKLQYLILGGRKRVLNPNVRTGKYKAGPRFDHSDDEYEDGSDDSAPSDDDAESHLGLSRKLNFKEKVKRKKKTILGVPTDAKTVYMTLSNGVKVKKFFSMKTSTKFVPARPWQPYPTQVKETDFMRQYFLWSQLIS